MPCYSKVQTVLIDISSIEEAAKTIGMTVTKDTANKYTLRRGNDYISIERTREGEKFSTVAMSGSNGYMENIVKPLTVAYARERVKKYYRSKGYTVAAGSKPNQLTFTKYS